MQHGTGRICAGRDSFERCWLHSLCHSDARRVRISADIDQVVTPIASSTHFADGRKGAVFAVCARVWSGKTTRIASKRLSPDGRVLACSDASRATRFINVQRMASLLSIYSQGACDEPDMAHALCIRAQQSALWLFMIELRL